MIAKGTTKNRTPDAKRVFGINIPEPLVRRVDAVAWRRNVSRSLVISEMIAAQLPSAESAAATKNGKESRA